MWSLQIGALRCVRGGPARHSAWQLLGLNTCCCALLCNAVAWSAAPLSDAVCMLLLRSVRVCCASADSIVAFCPGTDFDPPQAAKLGCTCLRQAPRCVLLVSALSAQTCVVTHGAIHIALCKQLYSVVCSSVTIYHNILAVAVACMQHTASL